MDSPSANRGSFYPTIRVARCASFHQCIMPCRGCQNYDTHSLICNNCEARKPGQICHHTDGQQSTIRYIDSLMKRPIFHPDQEPTNVAVPVADNPHWDAIANQLTGRDNG